MFEKIIKIFALIFLTAGLLLGVLSIYRATLKTADLIVITGTVVNKEVSFFINDKSGKHYCLAFKLANRQDRIAINLGTKSQADKDFIFHLINTGKTYKFYLDPTIPTQNGINWGINKIDYNHKEVYKSSNKLNLYAGILTSLLCATGITFIFKLSKKRNSS